MNQSLIEKGSYVGGTGPTNAKLAIVGEAPGREEETNSAPFWPDAPSGRMLMYDLKHAGLSRMEVYLTNVCKYRPPENQIKRLSEIGLNLQDCTNELLKELEILKPNCILAVGGTALTALTDKTSITKWRGSLLGSKIGIKVIPTIHPASIIRQRGEGGESYIFRHIVAMDIKKAVKESQTKDMVLPKRTLEIARSANDVERFLNEYTSENIVSLDIETMKCIPSCIALAFHAKHAMSIPLIDSAVFSREKGLSRTELSSIYEILFRFLNNPKVTFIGQNIKFDLEKLINVSKLVLPVKGKVHADTSIMAGLAYPEFPRSLAFLASVFTYEPYYKDEGKEFNPKKDSVDRLYLYNAKDPAVTYEVYDRLKEELIEMQMWDFYTSYVNKLTDFYMDIELEGLDVDTIRREQLRREYVEKIDATHKELLSLVPATALVKGNINVRSPKDIPYLLFKELKLPYRDSTQEDVLVGLLGNHAKDEKTKRIIGLIIDERQLRMNYNYIKAEQDYDGRMRTSYRII